MSLEKDGLHSHVDHRDGRHKYKKSFLIFLAALTVVVCYVLSPLASGIVWGTVLASLWSPVHHAISRHRPFTTRPNLCAITSFVLLVVCITIPLVWMTRLVLIEFFDAYGSISDHIKSLRDVGLPTIESMVPARLREYVAPLLADRERVASALTSLAQGIASFLQGLSRGLLQWTGAFIFQMFIALVTLFFMIRDGARAAAYVRELIPLPAEERALFIDNTESVMKSIAYGTILTVAVQALLGGLGWAVSGLPNPFLAAAVMFLCGMVPMGMTVVWLPGAIYLAATGSVGWGVALFAWGLCVVSMIDSFLRPIFIGSGSSIPTLALVLSLTGGLVAWGLLGIFIGPLITAIFMSSLDIYRQSFADSSSI